MKRFYSLSLILAIIATAIFSSCSSRADNSGEATSSTVVLLDGVQQSWDGAELIDYPTGKPSITMLKITVPPNCSLPQHYHPVINVGYMLEGELTVTDDKGNVTTIAAGEPLVETVNTIHYGANRGETDAVILVFYAGEVDGSITNITDTYPGESN
ncbi:MAG: cupin domain-containing protein [Rikenellaceae bacterium]